MAELSIGNSEIALNYTMMLAKWIEGTKRKPSMSIDQQLWNAIIKEVDPGKSTLEFGSGVSTFAFWQAAGKDDHTALENDHAQAQELGVQYCPLDGEGWYDWRPQQAYDVILVDGPHLGNRLRGLETIVLASGPSTVVFVDDVHREAEAKLAMSLSFRLQCFLEVFETPTKKFARLN